MAKTNKAQLKTQINQALAAIEIEKQRIALLEKKIEAQKNLDDELAIKPLLPEINRLYSELRKLSDGETIKIQKPWGRIVVGIFLNTRDGCFDSFTIDIDDIAVNKNVDLFTKTAIETFWEQYESAAWAVEQEPQILKFKQRSAEVGKRILKFCETNDIDIDKHFFLKLERE